MQICNSYVFDQHLRLSSPLPSIDGEAARDVERYGREALQERAELESDGLEGAEAALEMSVVFPDAAR